MFTVKSKISFIAVFALAMFLVTSPASAQNSGGQLKGKGQNTAGAKFIDANGDGVCDNFGTAKSGMKSGGNGKGRMGRGNAMGQGLKGSGSCQAAGVCDGTGPKGRAYGRTK